MKAMMSIGMLSVAVLMVTPSWGASSKGTAPAGNASACEKKIAATQMLTMAGDEKIVCADKKFTPPAQDCMVNLLTHGKGKLRRKDFLEVYALCRVDPSKEVQDCVAKHLDKPYNDPGYKGVHLIGDICLSERKKVAGIKFLHQPPAPWKNTRRHQAAPVQAPPKAPAPVPQR